MANTCYVTYKVTGEKKEVNAFHRLLRDLQDRKTPVIPCCNKLYLGCIINKLGGNYRKVGCRGVITDFDKEKGVLTINMETDWTEQFDTRFFLKKKFPNTTIYYVEEELEMGILNTNDAEGFFFPMRYVIEGTKMIYSDYKTIEEAAEGASQIVGHIVKPNEEEMEKTFEEYNKSHEKELIGCWFHKYKIKSL